MGQLEESEYEMLEHLINKKKLALELHNPTWKIIPIKEAMKNDSAFGLLPEKILTVL